MTGTTRSSLGLDKRRKRTLFHAWHRGIREMDLILGQFADNELEGLSEKELDLFEALLETDDRDLIQWVIGEKPVPEKYDNEIFARVCAYKSDWNVQK